MLAGEVRLLVFTTPPQVTILMDAAEKLGLDQGLLEAMNSSADVAAVGTVTAGTLARYGVKVAVSPSEANETMMGLVTAVENFVQKRAVRD